MSTGFDPYHAWLGLPPGSRPSNHYELLGLKLFASEPPVIADAADERIAKVKALLAGPQAAVAKQLFDQLTAARAALLSPAAKRAYDAQLRTQLGMPPAAEAKPPAAKTVRPSAPTVVMPPAPQPPAAPTVVMAPAAAPMAQVPMAQAPMAAIPVATQPMPVAAVPYGAPMMAQAVPMMAPGVAQAMPVMPGYAQGVPMAQPAMAQPMMSHPAMAPGYGAPAADGGLEDIAGRRRRRRRASSGQMTAVFAGLLIVGGLGAFGYVYREPLMAALEGQPPIVIHEGEPTPAEAPGSKERVAEDSNKAQKSAAGMAHSQQPPGDQMATNMGVTPSVQPPKRVRPKQQKAVAMKAKPQVAAMSVSIKPRSPEEKAAVGRSLAAARSALAERNPGKFEEQMNLAMLEASSADSLATIHRMRTLDEAYKEFWHAVRESCKGLKSVDELEIDGKKMIVIDADTEHLSVRTDGQSLDYKIEKLPTNMALSLAEQWLRPGDPSSQVVLGAFLAVDPKGDRQQARQLWQEAAGRGSEVAKTLLAQDAD